MNHKWSTLPAAQYTSTHTHKHSKHLLATTFSSNENRNTLATHSTARCASFISISVTFVLQYVYKKSELYIIQMAHYRLHKSMPVNSISYQFNPVHNLTFCLESVFNNYGHAAQEKFICPFHISHKWYKFRLSGWLTDGKIGRMAELKILLWARSTPPNSLLL